MAEKSQIHSLYDWLAFYFRPIGVNMPKHCIITAPESAKCVDA